MPTSDFSENPLPQASRPSDEAGANLDISIDANRWSRTARSAMVVMSALLGLGAIAAFGYFVYRAYHWVTTGGMYAPTFVTLPMTIGRFLRGVGLSIVCWQLAKLARTIDRDTGNLGIDFRWRLARFWKSTVWVASLLFGFWIFEEIHYAKQDPTRIFVPECFESGYASIKPSRFEIRRASEEPVEGWIKTHHGEKVYYVPPSADLSGDDVAKVLVRISCFLGMQDAYVDIVFTPEGAKKMEKLTTDHFSRPIAFYFDDQVRSVPRVFSAIKDRAQLTGLLTKEEASELIRRGGEQ